MENGTSNPDKQVNNRDKKGKFVKGKSGNPKGRSKKGLAIADILNSSLDIIKDGKTQRQLILEGVIRKALEGDNWSIEFIASRTEGKALERVQTQKLKDEIVIE